MSDQTTNNTPREPTVHEILSSLTLYDSLSPLLARIAMDSESDSDSEVELDILPFDESPTTGRPRGGLLYLPSGTDTDTDITVTSPSENPNDLLEPVPADNRSDSDMDITTTSPSENRNDPLEPVPAINRPDENWWDCFHNVGPNPERENLCIICYESIAEDAPVLRHATCGNCYHTDCVTPWFEEQGKCPTCRGRVGDDPSSDSDSDSDERPMSPFSDDLHTLDQVLVRHLYNASMSSDEAAHTIIHTFYRFNRPVMFELIDRQTEQLEQWRAERARTGREDRHALYAISAHSTLLYNQLTDMFEQTVANWAESRLELDVSLAELMARHEPDLQAEGESDL